MSKLFQLQKIFFAIFLFAGITVVAQDAKPVNITTRYERLNDNEVKIYYTLKPAAGIVLYGLQQKEEEVAYSSVTYDSLSSTRLNGKTEETGNFISEKDAVLEGDVRYVKDSVIWSQVIKIPAAEEVRVIVNVAAFYKKGTEFLTADETASTYIKPGGGATAVKANDAGTATASADDEAGATSNKSLWWIFLASFGGGLLALLTPCIYSMIPVTVSFFTKRSKTRAQGIRNAITYAVSIIFIFTLLGFLITLIFGPQALNKLSTNWIANVIFFVIFLIFGFSFLGAFEISLPSSWSTKADSKASQGSFVGIFFMALTLVLVSFSCTGPIIGNLLVLASKGNFMGPLIGMFGFSLALAIPFALFAFFPSKLSVLGKAGGWLNAIKVTLGFLELALALKFLSNADLTQNWRILDREVFIVLWIVIFGLLGLYLLGKLKFHHDDELPKNDFGVPYLSVTRLMFALTSLAFMVYLIPGLWGAPLNRLSAFIPPMGTQDFILTAGSGSSSGSGNGTAHISEGALPHPVKYIDVMKPKEPAVVVKNNMITYFEYEEALAVARKLKKPLMLDFTGVNCVNCREMEGRVWNQPEVMKRLKENFVIASLYVDVDKGVDLPEEQVYYSKHLSKDVVTLADRNADLQVSRYGSNSQPLYFFLDNDEKLLMPKGYPYIPDVDKFIKHLDEAKAKFDAGNK